MESSTSSETQHLEPTKTSPLEANRLGNAPAVLPSHALSRFEFETGKGNEGTKILMVEWLGDEERDSNWQVSWEGKTTVLPAEESMGSDKLVRIYFLLAPHAVIPRLVNISRVEANNQQKQTIPLPAIFPHELGTTAQGFKGVLHTIWAKKRLSVLQDEIAIEMKNGEGVGLEMALREKRWIEDNFGVTSKGTPESQHSIILSPTKPPRSGRLSQKSKKMSLGTSASQVDTSEICDANSPDSNEFALSSFPLFSSCGSTSETLPEIKVNQSAKQHPETLNLKSQNNSNINSIGAVMDGHVLTKEATESGNDLFAIKLSPRSPGMKRSPFSTCFHI